MRICLAMETADGEERLFPLEGPRLVLGRDTRCDLRVAVPSVSMQHCEILVQDNTLWLKDLDSSTGTFHNGSRVETAELTANDRVTIGSVTFVVRTDRRPDVKDTIAELKPRPTKETQPKAASGGSFSSET